MKIIALEEHMGTQMANEAVPPHLRRAAVLVERSKYLGHDMPAELLDLENSRLKFMDENGVDMQLLSLVAPGPQAYDAKTGIAVAIDANDRMYQACQRHPTRFLGLAALPTADVAASVKELERCVTKLGFKGTMINGHHEGEFLDAKKFWPIFEAAESLGVPIYLHPRNPSPAAMKAYFEGYEDLAFAAWGYSMDTATHFLRIVFSGVFDAYPKLKFILGHWGEGLPFWIHRLNDHAQFSAKKRGLKRSPKEYLLENLLITCSGNFSIPTFLCALTAVGIDNMMFSIDWPFESNKAGMDYLRHLPLSPADMEKFAHGNAERWLRIGN
ncbi:MAG TPA: amidohydrolase family protein [Stellaceae bacterium]|jgi:2,3-dihydroxybenzoate decarboxylase